MKIKKRIIVGALIVLLLTPASIYAVPKVNNFYQGYKLEKEGDKLLAKNEYREALGVYKKSQEKWDDKVISERIQKTEDIIESDENYQEGLEAVSNEDWDRAILSLSKVKPTYKDYESAGRVLDYAKGKKDEEIEEEEKVKGVTAEIKETPVYIEKPVYIKESPSPLPSPSPLLSIEPSPEPPPEIDTQNYEAICNAKKEQWVGEWKTAWNNTILGLYNKLKEYSYSTDPSLYSIMESYTLTKVKELNVQLNSCLINCAPKQYLYCLEHKGQITGFNWSAECPECYLDY